jgi:hypothetical protein
MSIYIIVSSAFSNAQAAMEWGQKVKRPGTTWYLTKQGSNYLVLRDPVPETQDKYLPGDFIMVEDPAKLLAIN